MQTEFKREYHINEITSELKQVDIFTKMSFDEKNSELTIVTTIPRSSNSISVYIHNKTNKTDNQRMLTNLCIVESSSIAGHQYDDNDCINAEKTKDDHYTVEKFIFSKNLPSEIPKSSLKWDNVKMEVTLKLTGICDVIDTLRCPAYKEYFERGVYADISVYEQWYHGFCERVYSI